jgi:hypothetical protein
MTIAAAVLAENNFGDTRNGGLAGPMGMFLIILLAIITVLLIRNMNSRLRRLPASFVGQPVDDDPDRAASAVANPTAEGIVSVTSPDDSAGSGPGAPTSSGNFLPGHDSR